MSCLVLQHEDPRVGEVTRYAVFAQGSRVGSVYSRHFTCERSSRGRMFVNSRWTSKSVEWRAVDADNRDFLGRFGSRKSAVDALLAALDGGES